MAILEYRNTRVLTESEFFNLEQTALELINRVSHRDSSYSSPYVKSILRDDAGKPVKWYYIAEEKSDILWLSERYIHNGQDKLHVNNTLYVLDRSVDKGLDSTYLKLG